MYHLHKQKFVKIIVLASLLVSAIGASLAVSPYAGAVTVNEGGGGNTTSGSGTDDNSTSGTCTVGNESTCPTNSATDCNDDGLATNSTKDYVANCTDPAASSTDQACTASGCNLVTKYVDPLIQLLSALVGIAVTISIIIGGIQYGSSAGDPQKVSAAKNRIRNSIIALLMFLFLYAFLQFLVPGGIFNR